MAQASNFVFDFVLTLRVDAGKTYTTADILALAPVGTSPTMVHLLSTTATIGIAGGDAVTWSKGDYIYLVTGRSWTFTSNAEVALSQLVNLVP